MTRPRIILLLTLSLLGIGLYRLMNATTYQLFGEVISKVDSEQKIIALTFDDGPSQRTDSILNILNNYKIKATFFVVGKDLEKNPSYGASIFKQGHQLANHSYRHSRMIFKSFNFIEDEIENTNRLIRKAGFTGEIMFRPPYGKKLLFLPYYLEQHQMKTIMWNIAPERFMGAPRTAEEINQLINEQIEPGSIILLHPMIGPNSSVEAVPMVIESLVSKGYKFVTVSRLLELRQKK